MGQSHMYSAAVARLAGLLQLSGSREAHLVVVEHQRMAVLLVGKRAEDLQQDRHICQVKKPVTWCTW